MELIKDTTTRTKTEATSETRWQQHPLPHHSHCNDPILTFHLQQVVFVKATYV